MDKKNPINDGRNDQPKKPLTGVSGRPIADNENIKTAGKRGGAMLDDTWYLEKMSHFNRDVIPERRMHAKCSGAFGTFTVTHYCPCEICCGKTDGITFTGTQATEGRTVAVDPNVIPLGSTLIIDGNEYIAEDIGGAIKGNRIDRYMDNHQEALNAGIVQAEVWIGG